MRQVAERLTGTEVRAAPWSGVAAKVRRVLRRRLLRVLVSSHLVAVAIILCREAGWLQTLELAVYDRLVAADTGNLPGDRVVLVAATEADIARFGWPLRDGDLAAVLERLTRWRARAIGVDIYRNLPLPPGSAALDTMLRANPDIVWVFKLPDNDNQGVAPPEALRESGRAVLADVVIDAGGVVRRGLLLASDPGTQHNVKALGLALAERVTGATLRPLGDDVALGGRRIPLVQERGGPYAAVDAGGYQTLLDFRGGRDRFRRFSVSEILDSETAAGAVAGRAVILGTEALSVRDAFATPFSTGWNGVPPLAGIELHAQFADQLIRTQSGISASRVMTPWALDRALIWLMAVLGGGACLLIKSAWQSAAVLGAGLAVLVLAVFTLFAVGFVVPGVPCLLAMVGSAAAANTVLHAIGLRERARLQRSFEHYLDPRIINDIVAGEELPSFGGEHRDISVLFSDVAGFTTFAETTPVDRVAATMHAYFDGVCDAAILHGGLVSEFTGDGVMILFGAPQRQDDHADRAVSAALAIDAFSEGFNASQRARGIAFGQTRIGVHTGIAVVGNLGTSTRMRYSAIGDLLNTASRIEGLNKRIGTRICVTRDTALRCHAHAFQSAGEFVVKGRHGVVEVATPLPEGEPPPESLLARYEAAYAALRDGRAEAAALFTALAEAWPENPCVAFHRRRLAEGLQGVRMILDEK
jgi:adenylate cyclase